MNSNPLIPVAIGEVFDKFSILEIKKDKISDKSKLKHVDNEILYLKKYIEEYNLDKTIYDELKNVNLELWNIEDKIRVKESKGEFDDEFIQLARSVYFTNDKRFECKKKINSIFNSNIYEVKSYVDYKNNNNLNHTNYINKLNSKLKNAKSLINNKLYDKAKDELILLIEYVNENKLDKFVKNIDFYTIFENIAFCFYNLKDFNSSIKYYKKANSYHDSPEIYIKISSCLAIQHKYKEAELILNKLLDNNYLNSFKTMGYIQLSQYKINEGLKYLNLFNQKIERPEFINKHSKYWNGNFKFSNIVIYTQGIGDEIQFGRYIIDLANKFTDAKIYYLVSKRSLNILNFNYNNIYVINSVNKTHDCHLDMFSLMYYLNINKITNFNYPSYILEDKIINKKWQNILKNDCKKKMKVCICWKGSRSVVNKGVSIENFNKLLCLDIDLISIQYDSIKELKDSSVSGILSYDIDKNSAFSDTIAIIRNSDLVITVDTSILHLSAVMGKKTWLMYADIIDWRWFNNNKTTEWYHNVTIFKSKEYNDWDTIFYEMKKELEILLNK